MLLHSPLGPDPTRPHRSWGRSQLQDIYQPTLASNGVQPSLDPSGHCLAILGRQSSWHQCGQPRGDTQSSLQDGHEATLS